jgi:hypothetical protein
MVPQLRDKLLPAIALRLRCFAVVREVHATEIHGVEFPSKLSALASRVCDDFLFPCCTGCDRDSRE